MVFSVPLRVSLAWPHDSDWPHSITKSPSYKDMFQILVPLFFTRKKQKKHQVKPVSRLPFTGTNWGSPIKNSNTWRLQSCSLKGLQVGNSFGGWFRGHCWLPAECLSFGLLVGWLGCIPFCSTCVVDFCWAVNMCNEDSLWLDSWHPLSEGIMARYLRIEGYWCQQNIFSTSRPEQTFNLPCAPASHQNLNVKFGHAEHCFQIVGTFKNHEQKRRHTFTVQCDSISITKALKFSSLTKCCSLLGIWRILSVPNMTAVTQGN